MDRVVFRVIGDESAQVSALRSGEVDIATFIPVHEISSEKPPGDRRGLGARTRSYFLEMNVNKPPFNDLRVRQAMNHAVDMDTIINVMYEGRATRIPFILSPRLSPITTDCRCLITIQRKLAASWPRQVTPTGFPSSWTQSITTGARAEIYQAMLAEVGIDVQDPHLAYLGSSSGGLDASKG